jgi:predicted Zn-dependent peptidase
MLMTQIEPHNLTIAQEAIKKVLRSISEKGIPEENINIAKFNYAMDQAKAFSTNAELSQSYQTLLGNNLPFSYYEDKYTRIKALSLDFINHVARTYCNPDTWTFVAVGRIDHATA